MIRGNRFSAPGSLAERKTRFVVLAPLRNKTEQEVRKAFAREMKSLPARLRRALTHDRGREMAGHKLFTRDTGI